MRDEQKHERYDIPHADILGVDVWSDEPPETDASAPAASLTHADARCPRCGATVGLRDTRCPSCERKLPQCSGSCSMCGLERCARSERS